MKRALIVSLNFNPGHVSHMVAYFKLFEELGYTSCYYIKNSFIPFLPANSKIKIYGKNDLKNENVDIALFTFPSGKNICEIIKLKVRKKSKIIYLFHEPIDSIKSYRKAGFSYLMLFKAIVAETISTLTVWLSDSIILPSDKAFEFYNKNGYYLKKNTFKVPLLYDDETNAILSDKREYFSYIGTIAADHSFNKYLDFIENAIQKGELLTLNFMIATKSKVSRDERIINLLKSGRLNLIEGLPLTNEQINACYQSSYVIWNAYKRTTQSGVLPKALMFGTPAIILKNNISEFVEDGREVVAINDNRSYDEILNGVSNILASFSHFSINCRNCFLKNYYYKPNTSLFIKKILK